MQSLIRKGLRQIACMVIATVSIGLVGSRHQPTAFAVAPEKPLISQTRDQFPGRSNVRQELTQWRERNVRHFLNPDGSFTAEVYRDPVFYEDPQTHIMRLIDNTLAPAHDSRFAFANVANRFNVRFAANTAATAVARVSLDDDAFLELKPTAARAAPGKTQGNSIQYNAAFGNADLKYEVLPNKVKESILLRSADAPSQFSFALNAGNLTPKAEMDGSIDFFQTGDAQPVLSLASPLMHEAGPDPASSRLVHQELRQDGKQLFVDVTVDQSWLAQPGRKFPVVVDPTVIIQPDAVTSRDTFASQAEPSTAHNALSFLTAGNNPTYGVSRSFLWFSLPGLPDGAQITSANLSLYMDLAVSDTTTIELHRVTSNWTSSSLTWNNQPTFSATAESSLAINAVGWWDFDATSLVTDWYNDAQGTYGFALLANPESANRRSFESGDSASADLRPKLTINYTVDPVGDQSFWTYAGAVNPFNGNLMLKAVDLATPGRGPTIPVGRTYNSRANRLGLFGYNWSSNLDMQLQNATQGPIILWDGSGTKHVFANNGDNTYKSPPGINYTAAWDTQNAVFTITTLDKTVYTFDYNGQLTKITDSNNQVTTLNRDPVTDQLTGITDASGRHFTVTVTSGRITAITEPAGRSAAYTYDANNNLTSVQVKQGTASTTVQYGYSTGTHRLISLTDPKGQVISTGYDGSNRVSSVSWTVNGATQSNTYSYGVNGDGKKTATIAGPLGRSATYTFNDNGNLTQVDVSTGTATLTTRYTWDLYNHPLSVTDPNNHMTQVDYNSKGQPVMVQDANSLTSSQNYDAGNNPVAAKNAKGNVTPNAYDTKNNQVLALDALGNSSMMSYDATTGNMQWSTRPISLGENLLANPGFEDVTGGLPTGWSTSGGSGTVSVDTTTKTGGYQALKLAGGTGGLAVRSANYISVVQGAQYMFTADVLTGSGNTAVLRVFWYQDTAGTPASPSNTGDLSVTTGVTNWSRKGTQITPPSGANYARVELAITSAGTVWFDNVEFETGVGRWGNNTLRNPGFDYSQDQSGQPAFWSPSNASKVSIDFTTAHGSPGSIKLNGVSGVDVYAGQRVDLSGDATTKIAYSGWARSVGGTSGIGTFAMQVHFKAADGTTLQRTETYFDPSNSNWHQAATVVQANQPFAYIMVFPDYYNQTGSAWFDDFEVHKFNPPSASVSAFNYVENSSFEQDQDGNGWPDGWNYSVTGGTATWTWEGLANAYVGAHSASVQNPTGSAEMSTSRQVPLDHSKRYTSAAYVKTEGLTAQLVIHLYSSTGTWLIDVASQTVSGTSDWTALTAFLDGTTTRSDAAFMRVGVLVSAGTGKAYFDNLRLLETEKRTVLDYDHPAQNYVTSVKDPLGNTTTLSVDANTGNVLQANQPNSQSSPLVYAYDYLNRLTSTSYTYQGTNRAFQYGYDLNSNLTSITDPNGKAQWSFGYNELNLPTSATQLVGGNTYSTSMTYDALGNLTKVSSPNGAYTQLTYDNANRMTKTEYGNGTNPPSDSFSFGYDGAGNLTSFGVTGGSNTTLAYDALNRLTSVTESSGATVQSAYDAANNRTSFTATIPNVATWSVNYQYDERNMVSQLTDNTQSKSTWFLYNEAGQLVKAFSQGNLGANYSKFYDYDAGGRVARVLVQDGTGAPVIQLRYTYDANSNVTRIDDDVAAKYVLYTYNELNELTKEEYWTNGGATADTTISYGYDELGNRLSMTNNGVTTTYSYNAEKNRLTAVGGSSYTYDNAGNLLSDSTRTYTWDNANRLKQVQAGTNTYSFTYDALGRRSSKTVNGSTLYYHYDGDRVAWVADANGTILQRFTYDGAGRPVYMGQNGTLYYYHYNAHGDVVKMTDLSGTTVASYTYDAWGNITGQSGSLAGSNPYSYAGYWYDAETGLYYLQARYYKPDVGRFISQDAWKGNPWQPSTQNLYSYVDGNPVMYIDPTGHANECSDGSDGCGSYGSAPSAGGDKSRTDGGFNHGEGRGWSDVWQRIKAKWAGGSESGLIDPMKVKYSQDSINTDFRDKSKGSIDDLAEKLKTNQATSEDVPPIRIVETTDGEMWTLDNRRLWAFKQAQLEVRYQHATWEEFVAEGYKFTSKNDGTSIRIRP